MEEVTAHIGMRGLRLAGVTGHVRQYVNVADVQHSNTGELMETGPLKKYREQYRQGREAAWAYLPRVGADVRGDRVVSDRLVIEDGTHHFTAAVLEGAARVLCEVERYQVKGGAQGVKALRAKYRGKGGSL